MVLAISAGLALVAACGDDSGATPSPTTTPTTPTTPTTTTPTTTTPTQTPPPTDVEVATINVLHGLQPPISGCAPATDQCNVEARVQILWNLLETDVGCPDIIALQEIAERWFEVVPARLPDLCAGDHVLLTEDLGLFDQEMILTTLPVIGHQRVELAGAPVWSAHWAQLEAVDGLVVDVFATHYASSSFDPLCGAGPATRCDPGCPVDAHLGDCHPVETLAFLDDHAAPGSLQLVVGDLNRQVTEPRVQTLVTAGFLDTYLAAGNEECPTSGGIGCTSGIGDGADTDYAGLDVAETVPRSRIDFILARPPEGCALVVDGDDRDGDGTRTGHWADTALDEPVDGLHWASDHAGIQADVGVDCP